MIIVLKILFTLIFLIYCSYHDLRYRRVPNKTWVLITAIGSPFILHNIISYGFDTVFTLAVVYSATIYILFNFNVFGGADAKLLIILTILFPLPYLFVFSVFANALLLTSIAFFVSVGYSLLKKDVTAGIKHAVNYKVPFIIPLTAGFIAVVLYGNLLQVVI